MKEFAEIEVMLLAKARRPEEVFPGVKDLAGLHKESRRLAAIVHPDANPQNTEDATVTFQRLTAWTERAVAKLKAGTWGDGKLHAELSFSLGAEHYDVFGLQRREALFDSYSVARGNTALSMHTPRKSRYERLVERACRALTKMGGRGAPALVRPVRLQNRPGYITTPIPDGAVPFSRLMEAYPDGVPLGSLLKLAMSVLPIIELAQKCLVVHCAINQSSWWFQEKTLSSHLVDWHYSVLFGQPVEFTNNTYDMDCPWEVTEREPTGRGTDLAALMKVVENAIGQQETPRTLDMLIAAHLREGTARPSCPATCYKRLKEISDKL